MPEIKTKPTPSSVAEYLQQQDDPQQREDAFRLLEMMREITGQEPEMWGGSIIGFGRRRYQGASGASGEWFVTGFAPRKGNLSIYLMAGFEPFAELLAKLGKHKVGKGCLYVKRLSDIDLEVLSELVRASVKALTAELGHRE